MVMSCRYRRADRRAQSSLEFIMIFTLLLAILSVGATVAWVRVYNINQASRNLEITKVLDAAGDKINLAFLEGDGFSTSFITPSTISGQAYDIEIHRNNVVIYFANSTYSKSLFTENVTGVIQKGRNSVINMQGEIMIS